MKNTLFLSLVIVALAGVAIAATPLVGSLQHQLKIQKHLQDENMAELERVEIIFSEAGTRIRRGMADFLHAKQQGENLESLRYRNEDLLQAEGELLVNLSEAQRLRRLILTTQSVMDQTAAEIAAMTGGPTDTEDFLSGTWKMVEEPGDRKGTLYLSLDGTLVQGTYELDGGYDGSMRGTLVKNRVRLERIDSQQGFNAIYYGKLFHDGEESRLVGKWEATNLSSGVASAGGWVAERVEDQPEY